jgi:hypothetical protein
MQKPTTNTFTSVHLILEELHPISVSTQASSQKFQKSGFYSQDLK